jgi:hypothetical protein
MEIDQDRIPSNLDEALDMLEASLTPEDIKVIKETPPEELTSRIHFFGGMAMRNDWSLWDKDTPFTKWFQSIGISHADDMSGIINTSLFRRVRGEEIRVADQVKYSQDYWTQTIGRPIP